ncbi:glycoside hydrolase family 18 protein [Bacteroides sp. 51]|uniref:glycoside hydrolase family 18 protein n=1 Tax=Bacteroides sp. 51 TaxID=2302938 RepID=UPI0013D26DB8|nr:glycoside hydrolase family 18 protein [Bacteroides sp. 51]NDV84310.1 hypothetical protein [Bacteroides sp. 51]
MKYIHFIYALLIGLILAGCSDDDASNPTFDDDELPKIYMEWASTYVYGLNDVMKYTAIVSPDDNITCRWLVDGEVVSSGLSVEHQITSPEPFTLRFEVERNGLSSYRTAQVTVTKPFEPKPHERVVMGVLTTNGTSDYVQWDNITHLMYTSLQVEEVSPTLKLPDATALARLKTVISLAHNEGVYVIIDIAGPMNVISGVGGYNQTALNQIAINPALRTQLIANIKNFVEEYDLDGVNISMNSANNDAGGLTDHAQIAEFMKELGEAFPSQYEGERGTYFVTASIPMAWNNGDQYGYLGGVDRLDWVNLMLFGGTDLSPVQHAPNWQIADNIAKFAGKGIPASKALVGIGAFGVKYDIPPGTSPTWGNIDEFLAYPTYKEILAMDADAAQKEHLQMGNAQIFYTGLGTGYGTNVSSKAGEAIAAGAKGMFIWTLDNDSQEASKSLTKAVYQAMNP